MSDTFARVAAILAAHLDIPADQIGPDRLISELPEFDSLDVLEIAMDVEDTFSIDVPDDELDRIETVADVVKLIDTLTTNKETAA